MSAIAVHERLIVALDVPEAAAAKRLVTELDGSVGYYKVGLELLMAGGCFELIVWLRERGKKVFADFKFFDVPRTVAAAVRGLDGRGASLATVHGEAAMLEAAVAAKGGLGILAVTVLTSHDARDLAGWGSARDVTDVVVARARDAHAAGCDGVIASGLEAQRLRRELGSEFLIVVPGIRPAGQPTADDQKRTVDVEEAFEAGADYIVVGRPILTAANPRAAADAYQARIAKQFAG